MLQGVLRSRVCRIGPPSFHLDPPLFCQPTVAKNLDPPLHFLLLVIRLNRTVGTNAKRQTYS